MSRSRPESRHRAAALALLSTAGLLVGGSAAAAPVAPVVPVTVPVARIVAPVVDISFSEADLKSEARVEQLPRRTTVTLDSTVLFGKDSAAIRPGARARLGEVGRQLQERGAGSLTITGYTDDLGTAAHGQTLSRERAAAVAKVLRGSLAPRDFRFTVKGRGEADPAVPNTSERNRRVNRRVVVVYVPS